jgi:WD40 repeat protein
VLQHPDPVESAIFSADGTIVLSADARATLRVWRTQTGALVRTARGVSSGPLALSPDGRILAVPDKTGAISLLSTATFARERELRRGRPFTVAAFSPDGSLIATAGEDGAARIWETATGSLVRTLTGHTDELTDVNFSRDGRLLVTASRDHDGRIWNVATGKMTVLLRGHFGPVFGARFSPDGRWVVTAGPTTAGLWQVATGHLLTYLHGYEGPLTSASFSPDGQQILTSGRDGTVRSYVCTICGGISELVALAERRLAALSRLLSPAERARYLPAVAAG